MLAQAVRDGSHLCMTEPTSLPRAPTCPPSQLPQRQGVSARTAVGASAWRPGRPPAEATYTTPCLYTSSSASWMKRPARGQKAGWEGDGRAGCSRQPAASRSWRLASTRARRDRMNVVASTTRHLHWAWRWPRRSSCSPGRTCFPARCGGAGRGSVEARSGSAGGQARESGAGNSPGQRPWCARWHEQDAGMSGRRPGQPASWLRTSCSMRHWVCGIARATLTLQFPYCWPTG